MLINAKRRRWNEKKVRPFLLSFNISIIISFTKSFEVFRPFSPCHGIPHHGQHPTSCKESGQPHGIVVFVSTSRSIGEKSTGKMENGKSFLVL